ncbi:MAG: DUF1772 domain-containing protein [Gemmatimonadales bacterium]|jgi:uncharacterized membrane protein
MTTSTQIVILAGTLLCSLVGGFLFAFAVVVMPGLGRLPDRAFIRGFQTIDGVIQSGQPLFGLVWLGSVVALVAALVLGVGELQGADLALLVAAGAVYLLGVQLPTFIRNVPLNNQLQAFDAEGSDDAACRAARERFEPPWNRWNRWRTGLAILSTAMLLVVMS